MTWWKLWGNCCRRCPGTAKMTRASEPCVSACTTLCACTWVVGEDLWVEMGGRTVERRGGGGGEGRSLMAIELFLQLLTLPFPSLPSRAEPQSQGNSQVLLDAPIQLSKITENYGESEGKLNKLLSPFSQPPGPSHLLL